MEFSLKSLKIHRDLSEETLCYTAKLLIDGKDAFSCSNRGTGGCDTFQQIGQHNLSTVEDWIRVNRPAGVTLFDFTSPLESLISRLIEIHDATRLLTAHLRTSFVFIENGTIQTVKPARGRKFDEDWARAVAEKFPERRRVTKTTNWEAAIEILTTPQTPESTS